ncbi:Ubiquinone biosynthesis protein coq9, mitochondrial [Rhizophlyctis rosea]|uniref:Ubiquinone biosynthesis protein n=1 Tax=Rhizophlyctis rosea TaxID=64517 RepID=A0AAD5SK29_9FUNG|nr:Ubiquinone biosynthesis protein coq9, mitochondrial [Rhizophlyctis rosea]
MQRLSCLRPLRLTSPRPLQPALQASRNTLPSLLTLKRSQASHPTTTPPPPSEKTTDFEVRYINSGPEHADTSSKPTTRILNASLDFVPTYGWTLKALEQGAASLGYPSITHGLFPRGGIELVEYFVQSSTRKLRGELGQHDLASMKVTAKIRTACIARLKMTAPYIKRWPEAVALMMQPQNLPNTMKDLGELMDEMWHIAGDRSVDMNWYSKRMMLAGVYTSTELYMTQDKSPDCEETWAFLDRRLQDVGTVGRTTAEVSSIVNFGVKSAYGFLQSRGIRGPFA